MQCYQNPARWPKQTGDKKHTSSSSLCSELERQPQPLHLVSPADSANCYFLSSSLHWKIFFPSWQTLKPQALCWFILSFIWSYPSASSSMPKCCFQNSLQAASDSLSSKKYCYEHKVQSWELEYLNSNPKIHPSGFGLLSPPTFSCS